MKIPSAFKKAGRQARAVLRPIGDPRGYLVHLVRCTGQELGFTAMALERLENEAQKTIREAWTPK